MKLLRFIALIFLSIHLFTVHSKLIFHANPDNLSGHQAFSYLNLSEQMIISVIISLSYSVITVILIMLLSNLKKIYILFIIWFAILDGIGVFIYYYYPERLALFSSIYYAIYTFSIIACFGLYRYDEIKTRTKSDIIRKYTQKQLAKEIGVSESLVSKVKNK